MDDSQKVSLQKNSEDTSIPPEQTKELQKISENISITSNQTKFCKHCGEKIAAAAVICPKCGCQVENPEHTSNSSVDTKFCKHCGEKIAAEAVICPKCGCQVENLGTDDKPTADSKDKVVAALLCFFLGMLGAHKFYENKVGTGIVYLLTFLVGWILFFVPTLILAIVCIVDFINLVTKPNRYYIP